MGPQVSTPDWLTDMRAKAEAELARPEVSSLDTDGARERLQENMATHVAYCAAAGPKTVLWLLDILQREAEHYDPGVWAEYEAGPRGADV